jgi:hypothetical protein
MTVTYLKEYIQSGGVLLIRPHHSYGMVLMGGSWNLGLVYRRRAVEYLLTR